MMPGEEGLDLPLEAVNLLLENNGSHHRFGLTALPPADLAPRLDLRGDLKGQDPARLADWSGQLYAEFDYTDLAAWQAWVDYPVSLPRGQGALRLWLDFAAGETAEATADLEAAVRRAQVVTAATRSHAPLIQGAWLAPGTHLDLVGGYTPDTREADDLAARRSRIFVDRRESAFDGVGDILQPIASGAIRKEDVLGDLYDLIGGGVPGDRVEARLRGHRPAFERIQRVSVLWNAPSSRSDSRFPGAQSNHATGRPGALR